MDYSIFIKGKIPFIILGASGVYILFNIFYRNYCKSNANSVDSNQTPQEAASDLSLHCLPSYDIFMGLETFYWLRWNRTKPNDFLFECEPNSSFSMTS